MEAAKVWIKHLWDIYTMEFYLAIKKKKKGKKILPFFTVWVDLEDILLSEISQPEKDKFYSYVESNEQTELTSKIETDSNRAG